MLTTTPMPTTELPTLEVREPEITITCGNCPESDECPGFDGCFYLAANCPKKKSNKKARND